MKSIIGAAEAYFWRVVGVYRHIDTVICCSDFMKNELTHNPQLKGKLVTLHNFIDRPDVDGTAGIKGDYVLYFGRYSEEKGIKTLIEACRQLPEITFVFAGIGPLENEINALNNVKNVGFKKGEALTSLIQNALFSVYPSEWLENCPFSVIESMSIGTPVLGADIGGIPELIEDGKNGKLFKSGNVLELSSNIMKLWVDRERVKKYRFGLKNNTFITLQQYANKILAFYENGGINKI